MKNYLPYSIVHVKLNEQLALPKPDTAKQGLYLVFWWHNLAIGDLYLQPGYTPSKTEYQQKFIQAILPTLRHYAGLQQQQTNCLQHLHEASAGELLTAMQTVLSGFEVTSTPEQVPISVVVCTRNRPEHLHNCLLMLSNLICSPAEIVVVDNAPSNDLSQEIVAQFEKVVYVREHRIGLDIARNTGIRQAKYEVVAFTDDDVTVHPLWAYQVWQTFMNPGIDAMTGLVIAKELQTEAQYIFEKYWSFNRGYADVRYDSAFIKKASRYGPPVWEIGAGANMAFRKSIFERVGYFNELLDVGAAGCSGDSEMWYRILVGGYAIQYNPRAIVFHEHRRETKGLKRQIYYYMRGHAAAALIQQRQQREAGYYRHLFRRLPKQYGSMLRKGFPGYHYRYSTLWAEMLGVVSGLLFYLKNKHYQP